jgi:5-keto-L-gluconate epimerase
MKIGAMVGTPDLDAAPVAVWAGPDLEGNLKKASDFGYDGVELMLKDPSMLDGAEIRRLLDKHGLGLVGLCSGQVFGEDGLGLIGPEPEVCRKGMERMKALVDFAAEHFGSGTMLNIGRSRGRADESDLVGSWRRAVVAFRELSDYALPKGIRLTLEPVNHHEVNYVFSTQDGIRMAREVDRPNFGLMLDTYHINIEDVNVYGSFREAKEYCWHVHYSDNNRRWPGNAHIDFPGITEVLREIGYDAYVSAEIVPLPDPDTAGRCTINYLRGFIPKD